MVLGNSEKLGLSVPVGKGDSQKLVKAQATLCPLDLGNSGKPGQSFASQRFFQELCDTLPIVLANREKSGQSFSVSQRNPKKAKACIHTK